MNKFEQVSSDDHGDVSSRGSRLMSFIRGGVRYSDVQYIMGNGHMGPLPHCGQTDARENITLPATLFAGGKNRHKKMNIGGGRMDFMFLGLPVPKTNISIALLTPKAANIKGKPLLLLYLLNSSYIILSLMFFFLGSDGSRISQCPPPWDLPMLVLKKP